MIVVCEGCDRRFHVDDARIPAQGARVRCKRCHHRFRVFPPQGEAAEPAPPSAMDSGPAASGEQMRSGPAASGEQMRSGPAASGEQTLFGRSLPDGELRFVTEPPTAAAGDRDAEPEPAAAAGAETAPPPSAATAPPASAEPAAPAAAAPASAPAAAPPPTPEAVAPAAAAPSEAGGEGSWEFADSSLSFERTAGAITSPPPSADPATTGSGLTGPGISLPADAPIEYDPSAIEPPPPGSGPDPEIFDLSGNAAYGQALDLAAAPAGSGEGGARAASGEADAGGAGAAPAEIGSAADWDRLAEEEPRPESSPPAAAAEPDAAASADSEAPDFSFEDDLPATVAAPAARTARAPWLEHAGWVLSLVLLLAVAHGSVRVQPSSPEVPPGRVEVAGLSAENVRGRFVETARSGTLFVVSGELHNRGSGPLRAGRPLQVVLLDGEGRPLPDASALVGTALPESAVRELPLGVLALQELQRAEALAGWSLGPGEGVAFHALVPEVPTSAVRFRIEPAAGGAAAEARAPAPAG